MNWIDEVHRLDTAGKPCASLDVMFDNVDNLMSQGRWKELDRILKGLDVSCSSINICVGWLSITFAGRAHLAPMDALIAKVRMRIKELAPDRVEGLMKGLE